jgi:pyrroline-5-carboxylate reductase
MPNTPAMIEEGVTVWTKNDIPQFSGKAKSADHFTDYEIKLCRACLACMGTEIHVEDENFIDMATSISGSGPAYIFMLVEAMVDAGVHMGFSRDIATKLVHQTLLGSTLYAMETKEHPAVLKNRVTSPAGTTASAMYELDKGRFRTVIQDAIWACYRRSLEMGGRNSDIGPGRSAGIPSSEFPDFEGKTKTKP